MGRSAPIDPVMAARLAAAAAAAAQAAADEAADSAADGDAASGTAERLAAAAATSPIEQAAAARIAADDGSPTLAENDRPDGVDDIAGATTVTGGVAGVASSLAPDLDALAAGSSATSRLGLVDSGGSVRDDMLGTSGLGLPGLGDIGSGSYGAGALAGAAPTLGNFSSGGGGIDNSSIMDGGLGSDVTLRQAWDHPILTGGKLLVDAVDAVADTVEDAADYVHDGATSVRRTVDAVYEAATDDSDSSDGSSAGSDTAGTEGSEGTAGTEGTEAAPAAATSDDEWVRWNEGPVELGPKTLEEQANYELNLWLAQQAAKADEDTGTQTDGTTNAEYHVQGDDDLTGNPYAGGYTGLLSGVTGHTGSGGISPLGPQGGSTTVNPGAEGFEAAAKGAVDLRGAVAYGGVKDPPKPVDGPAVLDAGQLEAAPAGADPGAVDPGDPNASTAAGAPYGGEQAMAPMEDPFASDGDQGRGFGQAHGQADEHTDGEGHGSHGGNAGEADDGLGGLDA